MQVTQARVAGLADSYSQEVGGFALYRLSSGEFDYFPVGQPANIDGEPDRGAVLVERWSWRKGGYWMREALNPDDPLVRAVIDTYKLYCLSIYTDQELVRLHAHNEAVRAARRAGIVITDVRPIVGSLGQKDEYIAVGP